MLGGPFQCEQYKLFFQNGDLSELHHLPWLLPSSIRKDRLTIHLSEPLLQPFVSLKATKAPLYQLLICLFLSVGLNVFKANYALLLSCSQFLPSCPIAFQKRVCQCNLSHQGRRELASFCKILIILMNKNGIRVEWVFPGHLWGWPFFLLASSEFLFPFLSSLFSFNVFHVLSVLWVFVWWICYQPVIVIG